MLLFLIDRAGDLVLFNFLVTPYSMFFPFLRGYLNFPLSVLFLFPLFIDFLYHYKIFVMYLFPETVHGLIVAFIDDLCLIFFLFYFRWKKFV